MFGWFKRKPKTLADHLFEGKMVSVHGIFFKIRKVNPVDYMKGVKAHHAFFQTYEKARADEKIEIMQDEKTLERVQSHMSDVFVSCVVEPKLCYAKDKAANPNILCVDNLFTDWELANELYVVIVEHSFGKKKT